MLLPHGTFAWIDLTSPDLEASGEFYSNLFDLEAVGDAESEMPYKMLMKDGKSVAGIGPAPTPQWPVAWTSYVLVDDVDAILVRVEDLGGSVVMPAMDIPDAGRMGVIADTEGAALSLWQGSGMGGAEVFNEHGALTWNELASADPEAARKFYGDLLGWTWTSMEMEGGRTYLVCNVEGKGEDTSNGGCFDMRGVFPERTPAHWDVYFHVDDLDAIIERATSQGGIKIAGPMDIGKARAAYLADPLGAMFYAIQPGE